MFNKTLKIDCSGREINNLYRVGKKDPSNTGIKRSVIIDMCTYLKRKEILEARTLLKGTGIYINEDLTKSRYDMLNMAKQKYGNRNVWINDGKLFMKKDGSVKNIRTLKDI